MQWIAPPKIFKKIYPDIFWRKETYKKEIFITFDDGPTKDLTPWIINTLNNLSIKATFFCVGENAKKHPENIALLIKNGHQIGNHTYSHINGWRNNKETYLADIEKCSEIIPKTRLFRPPYGKLNPLHISAIKKKYKIIMWDLLSYDFQKDMTKEKLKKNVLNNVKNGSIIVFHDNKKSKKLLQSSLHEILIELKNKRFIFKLFSSNTKEV